MLRITHEISHQTKVDIIRQVLEEFDLVLGNYWDIYKPIHTKFWFVHKTEYKPVASIYNAKELQILDKSYIDILIRAVIRIEAEFAKYKTDSNCEISIIVTDVRK